MWTEARLQKLTIRECGEKLNIYGQYVQMFQMAATEMETNDFEGNQKKSLNKKNVK